MKNLHKSIVCKQIAKKIWKLFVSHFIEMMDGWVGG